MTDEVHGENPPLGVWDAFDVEKRVSTERVPTIVEMFNEAARTAARYAYDLDSLIALIELHPTAQAGALLESWRQRKTQPPTKLEGEWKIRENLSDTSRSF